MAVLSDLHNVELGKGNENLLGELRKQAPDAILIAGDLVLGKEKASFQIPYAFLKEAVHIAPVYYALGNHEQRMKRKPEVYGEGYLELKRKYENWVSYFWKMRQESWKWEERKF